MKTPPVQRPLASKTILAINLVLTTAVGALFGVSVGQPLWVGAAGGTTAGALIIALLGLRHRLRPVRLPRPDMNRFDRFAARLIAPLAGAAAWAGQFRRRIRSRFDCLFPPPGIPAQPPARRSLLPPVETGDAIAVAIGNVVLLLILAVLLFGVEVAYVFAVIATPIWLLALMILALDGSSADDGIPLPDDLEAPE